VIRDFLARLSYRTRLTLAMVAAAAIPLVGLALVFSALDASLRHEADERLAQSARVAALLVRDDAVDANTAARLAETTLLPIALYDERGALVAASGLPQGVTAFPTVPTGGTGIQRDGATTAAWAPVGPTAAPHGYVAVVSNETLIGTNVDNATVTLVALIGALVLAVAVGSLLAQLLVQPLGRLSTEVARIGTGRRDRRMQSSGSDELAAVIASHNQLADALEARNRSLALVLEAIATLAPDQGVRRLVDAARPAAARAFGFLDVSIDLTDYGHEGQSTVIEDHVPGEAHRFPTAIRAGGDVLGTLWTSIPPTRDWTPADQALLEIFAMELGAAIRNAQLFAEVEELSETKSEFMRGVSHNLQTPLMSIRNIAVQLADAVTGRKRSPARARGSAEVERGLEIIVEQSERLSRLVDQLLIVSRLEAGTLHPRVEVFAPATLVRRAWETLQPEGDGLVVDDEAPEWLAAADRDRVDQVLWALLDNAVKYGRPPLEVKVRPSGDQDPLAEGEWLVVSVRDHGAGIPEADRERVFERFARLNESTAGTGLGLSVAQGLVEAMGGRLWIATTDGPGTTFAFSLPAERIEEA
jgi:signal transduction histidine kinase